MSHHIIRTEDLVTDDYDGNLSWGKFPRRGRLVVAGQRGVGFGLGFIPAGSTARKIQSGPLEPGPWGYAFGLPAVIDNYGGTRTEMEREAEAGLLLHAEVGDTIEADGTTYRIGWYQFAGHDDRHNITLTVVEPDSPGGQAASSVR